MTKMSKPSLAHSVQQIVFAPTESSKVYNVMFAMVARRILGRLRANFGITSKRKTR
jgi:hypothetical protein